jgi:hypothetical protein
MRNIHCSIRCRLVSTIVATLVAAGLAGESPALAQNFVKAPFPYLGKSCTEEGSDCTSFPGGKFIDFRVSATAPVGSGGAVPHAGVVALRRSDLDPQASGNWVGLGGTNFVSPNPDVVINNVAMRVSGGGGDSWQPGGMVRLAVITSANIPFGGTQPGSIAYVDGQYLSWSGIPTLYPTTWNIAGLPIQAAAAPQGQPGHAIMLMTDNSVAPSDEAKLGNFLTRKGSVVNPVNDTNAYYDNTCVDHVGSPPLPVTGCTASSFSIRATLGTLTQFRSRYGMSNDDNLAAPPEFMAKYYNRGDLGIGRNMHCTTLAATNEIACYVKNYSSDTPKIFGGSAATAFSNMDANIAFATVAMVNRGNVPGTTADKVIFMVYNAMGNLQATADLDRHAAQSLGVEGQNYNRHIPSNCMNCHGAGGSYQPQNQPIGTRGARGAMFLPFDLDQFDYHPSIAALSRANQEAAFKNLNTQIVKPVADQYGVPRAGAIISNVNGWYNNGASPSFISSYVPSEWSEEAEFGDKPFYQKVLRPYCRLCHMTFGTDDLRSFETWSMFGAVIASAALNVCPPPGATPGMPQAEQVSRQMWGSDARGIFVGYTTWSGIQIKECIPGPNR